MSDNDGIPLPAEQADIPNDVDWVISPWTGEVLLLDWSDDE